MVTCAVVVTVLGRGQLAPEPIGLPGRLLRLVPGIFEGRAEREIGPVGRETPLPVPVPVGAYGRVLLESGYGAFKVAEAMGTPVPVPLCALIEVERAKMLASVVKTVNGAIAMSVVLV